MSKKINDIPEFIKKLFGNTVEEIVAKKLSNTTTEISSEVILKGKMKLKLSAEEVKKLCKKVNVEYKEGYEERVIQWTCSDESVDRYGDIIKQSGWKLDSYKKNPVILTFHDYGKFPIGNSIKTFVENKELKMWILFADKEVSEDAEKAFQLAKAGFVKAGSVGFMPIQSRKPTDEERAELVMGNPWSVIYEKQDLMEFSLCGVPANPNAVQDAIKKGIDIKSWVDVAHTTPEKTKTFAIGGFPEGTVKVGDPVGLGVEAGETTIVTIPVPEEGFVTIPNAITPEILKDMIAQAAEEIAETKAGATLSKKNKSLLSNAITSIRAAATHLDELLSNAEPENSEDKSIDPNIETQKALDLLTLDDNADEEKGEGSINYEEIEDILKLED